LKPYSEKKTYTIRLGNTPTRDVDKIIASLKFILEEGYDEVVSEHISVGNKFFSKYDDIIKKSLGDGESLAEKMLSVLLVLKPTVQFTDWRSDLPEAGGFDLAYEFSQISAKRKSVASAARAEAKLEAKANGKG
jgi:hypothetical protein